MLFEQDKIRLNGGISGEGKSRLLSKQLQELTKINQLQQRQDSITNQMHDLYFIANKFGLYDCADFIRDKFLT